MLKTTVGTGHHPSFAVSSEYIKWRNDIQQMVKDYWLQHNYSPSVRDIQEALGANSTSVIDYHLKQMIKRGDILADYGVSRSFRLPGQRTVFE